MKTAAKLAAAALIALTAIAATAHADDEDLFHPVDLQDLAKADPTGGFTTRHGQPLRRKVYVHTHVEIDGLLVAKHHEKDGDTHLEVCVDATSRTHGGTCVIAECIPDLKGIATWCGSLKKGQRLKLKGSFDWEGTASSTNGHGYSGRTDRDELLQLLGWTGEAFHPQGLSIPAGETNHLMLIDRAHGRAPRLQGESR